MTRDSKVVPPSRVLVWLLLATNVSTLNAWSTPFRWNRPLSLSSSSFLSVPSLQRDSRFSGRNHHVPLEQSATSFTDPMRVSSAASTASSVSAVSAAFDEKKDKLRREGGLLAFHTKYGALNPFAIYYGLVSIFLGIFWYTALTTLQFFYWITRGKLDRLRRFPILVTHVWGTLLMRLSRSTPEMVNLHILKEFYKRKQPAMFVANHNSWMDIPFLGATVGWRNYKLVSKKELGRVPILGKAIRIGGHIMVDRTDRRSQLLTLKNGINYLKDGVHLCTFPEGTRSKTGRLGPFKNGAFKMAHKAGAPVIPVSIVASGKVMPSNWMFPNRPSYGVAKVIVHEPIESKDKTEEELAEEVRRMIISGLPEDQRPE